jgi:hypothetical protein
MCGMLKSMGDTENNLLWEAEGKSKLKPHQLIQSLIHTMIYLDISQYVLNESVMSDVEDTRITLFQDFKEF